MFKIKTSLIQGLAALLITSSLWATPNHDDDNVESFALRGMEAPANQASPSTHTSPSTSSPSTDLSTTASDCHVTSFLAVTVSESVIASAARQSTDLLTADKVWPPKWSPIEDERALANLPRLVLDEIFQWLLCTGVDNVKNAAFTNRYWHRYTQSEEFKNTLINAIEKQVGNDSCDAFGYPKHLFEDHRTYFETLKPQALVGFVTKKTFAGALDKKDDSGQLYRKSIVKALEIFNNPCARSLTLTDDLKPTKERSRARLKLSPTVHFNFTQLIKLDLQGNALIILPDLEALRNLQILDLSHNGFEELPEITRLKQLRCVFLNHNPLSTLPDLRTLMALQVLNVSMTALQNIEGLENLLNLNLIGIGSENGPLTSALETNISSSLIVLGNKKKSQNAVPLSVKIYSHLWKTAALITLT